MDEVKETKKEAVKKPEVKKKKKYVGKTIHFFSFEGKRRKLEPNKFVPEELLASEEIKRLIKDKKVIDV